MRGEATIPYSGGFTLYKVTNVNTDGTVDLEQLVEDRQIDPVFEQLTVLPLKKLVNVVLLQNPSFIVKPFNGMPILVLYSAQDSAGFHANRGNMQESQSNSVGIPFLYTTDEDYALSAMDVYVKTGGTIVLGNKNTAVKAALAPKVNINNVIIEIAYAQIAEAVNKLLEIAEINPKLPDTISLQDVDAVKVKIT